VAIPSGSIGIRIASVAASLSVFVGCIDVPGRPDDPQDPECLENAVFGDPDDSPYILPYAPGKAYEVFQTYCGPVSHGKDGQMSIDFLMPLGSEVVAARAGVVRRVHDREEDFGSGLNVMFIEHDDGTSAFYGHLQRDSASVAVGDHVVAGQMIARSGASGTSLPHLHFGVAGSWPVRLPDGVPVNFRNADGELDERGGLQAGAYYRALPLHDSVAGRPESARPR
jgi:murein DD-endopeptidase MepM/ murein hydrolase activator NlpD